MSVVLTHSDATSVFRLRTTDDASAATFGVDNVPTQPKHTLSDDGNPATVYFFVKDAAGLTSTSSSASIIVDSTAPTADNTLSLEDTNSSAGYSQTDTFTINNVSYFTDGTGTGITHYYFTDNASVSASDHRIGSPADLASTNANLTNGSGNTPVKGTLDTNLFAKDLLGNTASQMANIVYDNTAPTNSSTQTCCTCRQLYPHHSRFKYAKAVIKLGDCLMDTTTLNLSDGGSGVLGYVLNDNATAPNAAADFNNTTTFELDENTSNNLYLHAIDNAYNNTPISIGSVVYDTTSPLLNSISLSDSGGGADNATIVDVPGNTDDTAINISLSATDASGVKYVVVSETALSNTEAETPVLSKRT